MRRQIVLATLLVGGKNLFIEALRDAHSALLVSDRYRPNLHRYPVSLLVEKEHQSVAGLAFVHDSSEWTTGAAKNAVLLVTLSEDVFAAGAPNHIVTPVAGDSLCAIVPEHNFPVTPDHVHSGRQALQDGSKDIRILKVDHRRKDWIPLDSSIGGCGESFRYSLPGFRTTGHGWPKTMSDCNCHPMQVVGEHVPLPEDRDEYLDDII
jgi:hypothetical protein